MPAKRGRDRGRSPGRRRKRRGNRRSPRRRGRRRRTRPSRGRSRSPCRARRLRHQAPDGISPSQLSALSTLERIGPLTQGELASTERVKPPTMTRIVAALEDEGLIQRKRDEADKRCSRLSLTKEGRQFIDRSRTRKPAAPPEPEEPPLPPGTE